MRSRAQFYVMRFILGLCETGAYPGEISPLIVGSSVCVRLLRRALVVLISANPRQASSCCMHRSSA